MSATVSIRSMEEGDLQALNALNNDVRLARWLPHILPQTEAQTQEYWQRVQDPANAMQPHSFAVEVDGAWAGVIHAALLPRNPHGIQFGYYLKPELHGKGLMPTAVAQFELQPWVKSKKRLQTLVAPENAPSRRLMEKCGFEMEGVLRSYLLFQERLINVCIYAKINGSEE